MGSATIPNAPIATAGTVAVTFPPYAWSSVSIGETNAGAPRQVVRNAATGALTVLNMDGSPATELLTDLNFVGDPATAPPAALVLQTVDVAAGVTWANPSSPFVEIYLPSGGDVTEVDGDGSSTVIPSIVRRSYDGDDATTLQSLTPSVPAKVSYRA